MEFSGSPSNGWLGIVLRLQSVGEDQLAEARGDRAGAVDHRVRRLDAENIFITLTARELRATSRSSRAPPLEDTEKKLKRAGADRVISPYKASGTEMARLALHRS